MKLKTKIADYRKRLSEVENMQLSKDRFISAVKRFMAMDYLLKQAEGISGNLKLPTKWRGSVP